MEADTRRCKVNVTENAPEESKGVKQAKAKNWTCGGWEPGLLSRDLSVRSDSAVTIENTESQKGASIPGCGIET